ncbi:hypothetical protein KAJ83_12550 [Marivibrio halodurans]|uniref:Motility protein n=1 Tax=Marivibrio halodurans TaxID=2039722 RepID=A0A8J7SNR6_9PROT|nr:hypothetical protein [Marivibrio halodurans]MBP5857841.1 hypothetical protein [Marivibrio halodurans]
MSVSAAGAVALSNAVTQQNFAIAAVKQQQRMDEGVLQLVTQAVRDGGQALNSSGRGQVVNILT